MVQWFINAASTQSWAKAKNTHLHARTHRERENAVTDPTARASWIAAHASLMHARTHTHTHTHTLLHRCVELEEDLPHAARADAEVGRAEVEQQPLPVRLRCGFTGVTCVTWRTPGREVRPRSRVGWLY
jgi:hypothetical protein